MFPQLEHFQVSGLLANVPRAVRIVRISSVRRVSPVMASPLSVRTLRLVQTVNLCVVLLVKMAEYGFILEKE